jgi:hypothetical protein
MAKATKAVSADTITGYCMKTKEKNVVLQNCTINKNGNRFIALGDDGKGNKISSIVGEAKATAALAAGTAKKGTGWSAKK